jgi:hypothetical protein
MMQPSSYIYECEYGSFRLTPATGYDTLFVARTPHILSHLGPTVRMILRTVTHLNDRLVWYPLRQWSIMPEELRQVMRQAYHELNSPSDSEKVLFLRGLVPCAV